jgi:beta-N-acetylhexosaminidase
VNTKSLVEDFGQLFIMAINGKVLRSDVAEFFSTFRIGGVILFEDNFESVKQLRELVDEIQSRCSRPGEPLLIAVDQEGGQVQRFRDGFSNIPPASALGEGSIEWTEQVASRTAAELNAVGVNFNLAPVADLSPVDREGAIGSRSFGTDPIRTSLHVRATVRGLQKTGVLACAKHFPGHGATTIDSRKALPDITRSLTELFDEDLIPFQAAIQEDVAAIMTAHATYSRAEPGGPPATLSRFWCHDVLRKQLGFEGAIVTDALEMKALSHFGPCESGVRAMQAGADILLYYREAHQFRAFAALRKQLDRGELDYAQIKSSIERVKRLKMRVQDIARNVSSYVDSR